MKKKTPGKVYQDVFTFHILLKNIANRILRHKVIIIYMYNSKQHSLCKDFQQKQLNSL